MAHDRLLQSESTLQRVLKRSLLFPLAASLRREPVGGKIRFIDRSGKDKNPPLPCILLRRMSYLCD